MDAALVGSSLILGSSLLNNTDNLSQGQSNSKCHVAKNIYDNSPLNSRVFDRQTVQSHMRSANTIQNNFQYLERPESGRSIDDFSSQNKMRSLTGEIKLQNEFTHNNMVPFFGSKVRQNVDSDVNVAHLENFTGVYKDDTPKGEIAPMFELNKNEIHGNVSMTDELKVRYNPSRYHQSTPLTQPINVGPGLNQGYTAEPSGGFQQPDTRKYAMRPNVDELRTKNNPKKTFEGRIVSGFIGSRRGIEPKISQNRVIRFHEYKTMPRMNTTVVHSGQMADQKFLDKETRRQNTLFSYSAPAGPTINKPSSHNEYRNRTTHRKNLDTSGMRNAQSAHRHRLNIKYCSEKTPEDSKENTYLGNVKTTLQQIVAPIQDVLRTTIKETNIHDSRDAGNVASVIKQTPAYDTDDVARTTIKETMIDNERIGTVGNADKRGHFYNPTDTTRPTIKETNIHDNRTGPLRNLSSNGHSDLPLPPKVTARDTLKQYVEYANLQGAKTIQTYNDEPLKKTVKETIGEDNHLGMVTNMTGKGYITNPMTAPPTNKQFTSDNDYSGQAIGTQKGSYSVTKVEAPETARQSLSDVYYSGTAEGRVKPVSYQDVYNATMNEIKEEVSQGRHPTLSGPKEASDISKIGKVDVRVGLENRTVVTETPIQNTMVDPSVIQISSDNCSSEIQNNRNDPSNLKPFTKNPYTQSLNSIA